MSSAYVVNRYSDERSKHHNEQGYACRISTSRRHPASTHHDDRSGACASLPASAFASLCARFSSLLAPHARSAFFFQLLAPEGRPRS